MTNAAKEPMIAATLKDIITKSSNSLQTQDFNGTNNKQQGFNKSMITFMIAR